MLKTAKLEPTGRGRLVNSPLWPTHYVVADGNKVGYVTKSRYGYHVFTKEDRRLTKPNAALPRDLKELRSFIRARF